MDNRGEARRGRAPITLVDFRRGGKGVDRWLCLGRGGIKPREDGQAPDAGRGHVEDRIGAFRVLQDDPANGVGDRKHRTLCGIDRVGETIPFHAF